jgi:phosphoglycolate phosphatase-like HAD superfamily hydrolase
VNYHKENGGVTRQVKIEALCQKINDKSAYNELLERYETHLEKEWLNCPLLPGFRAYIENIAGVNVILSGGSKVEIETYLKENNLDQYFLEVFGNPIDKHVNLDTIKEKHLGKESDVYFYGDSRLDYDLSKLVSAKFIFIKGVSEWHSADRFVSDFWMSSMDFRQITR